MIPEIFMNKNPEIKTHEYMQESITPKNKKFQAIRIPKHQPMNK
jgi:hypothetical protein